MGRIRISLGEHSVERPLAANTVLGRAAGLTWTLSPPLLPAIPGTVPSTWVELRWLPELRRWRWSTLRGPVDHLGPTGRLLTATETLEPGARLRCNDLVVELVDDAPPTEMVVDTERQEALPDPMLVVEHLANAVLSHSGEGPLTEGQLFAHEGKVYRYHAGTALPATRRRGLDLLDSDWHAIVDVRDAERPVLSVGERSLSHRAVHLLAVYVDARQRGEEGGFVGATPLRYRLAKRLGIAGGELPRNFASDYRRDLKALMERAGFTSVGSLFEYTANGGENAMLRLRPPPDQFTLVES